ADNGNRNQLSETGDHAETVENAVVGEAHGAGSPISTDCATKKRAQMWRPRKQSPGKRRANHAERPRRSWLASDLRAGQSDLALRAEDVAVKIRDPLTTACRHVQAIDGALDVRRNHIPVELRIAVDDVGRRFIAELAVDTDFLELV